MSALGVIGGTGLDDWGPDGGRVAGLEDLETPWGRVSAPLRRYERDGRTLLFLARHGTEHAIAPHRVNYRANLHALKAAGVRRVIAVNAVGGMSEACAAGALVVPDQLVDYTWGREHTYCDGVDGPLRHIEFGEPFSDSLRTLLLLAGEASGVALVDGGCIGVTQGPRLETAAEVRRLVRDGCDLVGMTSQPEAALAREAGLDYATLAVVSNPAAGMDDEPISLDQIHATLWMNLPDD